MALYVNTNISSIDILNKTKSASSVQTCKSIHDQPANNIKESGVSEEVVDITDSLSSILSALGVDKSQIKTAVSDHIKPEKTNSSELDIRDKSSVANAVKTVQNNILSNGATSILAQANEKTLYALSLLED